eukprot:m.478897 g.478897  ORF g.478897 m.478897 type:complete len:382 (+) comp21268_c0_seq1:256-1401(+)
MKVVGDGGAAEMQFVTFNQDSSRLSVGTRHGYQTYALQPLKQLYEKRGEPTGILEMLFNTSLVAHVGADGPGSSTCLRMINTKREKEIIRMNYNSAILAVKLNRQRLVVVLTTTIYIYDITNMHLTHTIGPTPPNPTGVCALSSCHVPGESGTSAAAANYFAYPGNPASGQVYVYDTENLRAVTMLEAHSSPIACLAFSSRGDRLATASVKGTVIKIFSLPDGQKLFELRRGRSTNATIYSMSFNLSGTMLCVSSNKQTVHIFKLDGAQREDQAQSWSVMGLVNAVTSSAATMVPTTVSELWTQERSFAQFTLPEPMQNICTLVGEGDHTAVMVATTDGKVYKYRVDCEAGGECVLAEEHHLALSQLTGADGDDDDAGREV